MGLSSKLAVGAGLGALLVAPALAAGPGVAAHPVAPRLMHIGPGPGHFPGHRVRRLGDRYGLGYGLGDGYGFGGQALSTYQIEGGAPAPVVVAEPPPIPPQPACPMVIKVGPGLDHPVRTQVIYGRPACN